MRNGENNEILIRIFFSFLNRNTDIIMDRWYDKNPMSSWVATLTKGFIIRGSFDEWYLFVCLFVLWHINFCRLFDAKSILYK